MKPLKSIKIEIMGHTWVCKMFKPEIYNKIQDDSSLATCSRNDREIHFNQKSFSIGIVRHEVRHAFQTELCFHDADLTMHDMEEINCTLDERNWENMNKVSVKIYQALKK